MAARSRFILSAGLIAGLAACNHRGAAPASPHYVVGTPYQAGDVWYYPAEHTRLSQTGIAAIDSPSVSGLTADGERYDPQALAAAHQTLQLPAIARITNLENGLSLRVRLNDRGPASPSRLVSLTPRAAELLRIQGPAKIRLDLDEAATAQLRDHFRLADSSAPLLQAAPRQDVAQESLSPPPGAAGTAGAQVLPSAQPAAAEEGHAPDIGPLPEQVEQGVPTGGNLYIKAGTFSGFRAASIQAARLRGLGARIERAMTDGQERDTVVIGPVGGIAEADAMLSQVLAAGVPDARIAVAADSAQLPD